MKKNLEMTKYEAPEMVQITMCVEQCLLIASSTPGADIDDWKDGDLYE